VPQWFITFDEKERAQWVTCRVITGGTTRRMLSTRRSRRADTAIIDARTTMNSRTTMLIASSNRKNRSPIDASRRTTDKKRSITTYRDTFTSWISANQKHSNFSMFLASSRQNYSYFVVAFDPKTRHLHVKSDFTHVH